MPGTTTSSSRTTLVPAAQSAPGSEYTPATQGPVLLATQGFGASHSPTLLARLMAAHLRCALRVVTVVEPVLVYTGSSGLLPTPMLVDDGMRTAREESVRETLESAWPTETNFQLETRFGGVPHEIAAHAREVQASVLVVGAAPRRRRTHVLTGVLAAQVLRKVHCPVLSVMPGLDHIPREVVVAVDFSNASVRAAREALRMMAEGGTITLAYAIPMQHVERLVPTLAGVPGPEDSMQRLGRLRDRLARWTPPGGTIKVRVLHGLADDSIIELARSSKADLVAVGTHGPGVFERTFIGSTAANILHRAPCSVLGVQAPDDAQHAALDLELWGDVNGGSESPSAIP